MEGNQSLDEEENPTAFPVGNSQDKFACFICKSEFEDENAFKTHYMKDHAGMGLDDAEKLRDVIERSRLQSDAVSKEYGLRETASRKAFRSEIVFTEQCLRSPPMGNDGHGTEAEPSDPDVSQNQDPTEQRIDENGIAVSESQELRDATESAMPVTCSENGVNEKDTVEEPAKINFFAAALNLKVTP